MASKFMLKVGAQVKKALAEDHPSLLYLIDEADGHNAYAMMVGLPYPYLGGEVIMYMKLPDTFPRQPPSELRCFTPENGVYGKGMICISVGNFHETDRVSAASAAKKGDWGWKPQMGLRGFANEVLNGFITPENLNLSKHPDSGMGGLGILDTTPKEREYLSARTMQYNIRHNPRLRFLFWEHARANPHLKAAKAWFVQVAACTIREIVPAVGCTRKQFVLAYCGDANEAFPEGGEFDCDRALNMLIIQAYGENIAAQIPVGRELDYGRALSFLDPDFREGYIECETCADAAFVDVALQRFPFLEPARGTLAGALASGDSPKARSKVMRTVEMSMRQEFTQRDRSVEELSAGDFRSEEERET